MVQPLLYECTLEALLNHSHGSARTAELERRITDARFKAGTLQVNEPCLLPLLTFITHGEFSQCCRLTWIDGDKIHAICRDYMRTTRATPEAHTARFITWLKDADIPQGYMIEPLKVAIVLGNIPLMNAFLSFKEVFDEVYCDPTIKDCLYESSYSTTQTMAAVQEAWKVRLAKEGIHVATGRAQRPPHRKGVIPANFNRFSWNELLLYVPSPSERVAFQNSVTCKIDHNDLPEKIDQATLQIILPLVFENGQKVNKLTLERLNKLFSRYYETPTQEKPDPIHRITALKIAFQIGLDPLSSIDGCYQELTALHIAAQENLVHILDIFSALASSIEVSRPESEGAESHPPMHYIEDETVGAMMIFSHANRPTRATLQLPLSDSSS